MTDSNIERNNTALSQFFIFCSVNIGILGLIMGAIITMFNLSFTQCLIVAVLGPASYILVGIVSIAGHDRGQTTLLISQEVFGIKGNIVPNVIAWIQFVGWLIVNVVTSTLIIMSIFKVIGLESNSFLISISVLAVVCISCLCCLVSMDSLAKIQQYLTIIFGGATVLILIYLMLNLDLSALYARPSGSFFTDMLPALSIMIAGTGIGWVLAGADYSCSVKKEASQKGLFLAVTLGGLIPLSIMFIAGVLMTSKMDLASSANPMDLIASALPSYFALPYYLISLGGLLPQCIIGLKTSDINFNTVMKTNNPKLTIALHAVFMISIALVSLLTKSDLLLNFQAFLTLTGIAVAAWASVFICDFVIRKLKNNFAQVKKVNVKPRAIIAWAIGTIVGLAFTNCPIYEGPFATGVFKDTSLGLLVSLVLSAVIFLIIRDYKEDSKDKDLD